MTPARGANAGKPVKPQPGIYVFTDRHYATVRVLGDTPREVKRKDQANPTVAELLEENRIAAQGGTSKIKGDTITFRPTVARSIANMAPGNSLVFTYKIDGGPFDADGPSGQRPLGTDEAHSSNRRPGWGRGSWDRAGTICSRRAPTRESTGTPNQSA